MESNGKESQGELGRTGRGKEINLKLTITFLFPTAFMLVMTGCGGGSQIDDTPTPEAKVAV